MRSHASANRAAQAQQTMMILVVRSMPVSAGAASMANAATRDKARVENIREFAIVCAD